MLLRALFVLAGILGARAFAVEASPGPALADYGVGSWIWDAATTDRQTCRFWKRIEIPADKAVVSAIFRITADNEFVFFLDGREIGRRAEWRIVTEYDLSQVLTPGPHIFAVQAYNDYMQAGMAAGLRVTFTDGTELVALSDTTWKIVPNHERGWLTRDTSKPDWTSARIVAPFLSGGWNHVARILPEPPVRRVIVHFWETGWFQIMLVIVSVAAVFACVYLLSKLAGQKTAQQVLQKERARIARDIHDDFGARLTKLVLFGELAQNELVNGSPVRARLDQISAEGRSLLNAVDEVIWTINSRRDTLQDFEAYVCRHAETLLHAANIKCRIDCDPDLPHTTFDLTIRRNLFLAVKEALTNTIRHSGATEVQLGIHLRDDRVTVNVGDNGHGFDSATANVQRNGLSNMAQRMAEISGSCEIISKPGEGCRVEFTAPTHASQSAYRRLREWFS